MRYFIAFAIVATMVCVNRHTYAQNLAPTYTVVNDAGLDDLAPYHQALQSANLLPYRHLDSRRLLSFDNGLKVELFSVAELEALGMPVETEGRLAAAVPKRDAVFSVKGGFLVEQVRPGGKQAR